MTSEQFSQFLLRLHLSATEAAQLLSVSPRTVRRWLDGEELPGPVERAIEAWVSLHEQHLPWRPDQDALVFHEQGQIQRHRQLAIELSAVLERVEARGGVKLPWSIDWDRGVAELGPMKVRFYKLVSGSFTLASCHRSDRAPDANLDREMIEDAVWSIAAAVKRNNPDYGPVKLIFQDGPAKNRVAQQFIEDYPTIKLAIERACRSEIGSPLFYAPMIVTESVSEVLWDTNELRRECMRRKAAPAALASLARYVRINSSISVRKGPHMLSPSASARKREHIESLAGQIDVLAAKASDGLVRYEHFEEILGALHSAGFFPDGALVSTVAQSLEGISPA